MSAPRRGRGRRTAASAFWKLVLGSVGVVYGDIGTSPLYALREALHAAGRDGLDRERGDRHRLAAALDADPDRHAQVRRPDPARRQPRRGRHAVAARARPARGRPAHAAPLRARRRSARRCSTATRRSPRRSRCSRRSRASSSSRRSFDAYVLPITVAILVALFWVQSRGTGRVSVVLRADHRSSGSWCWPRSASSTPATGRRSSPPSIPRTRSASCSATASARCR